MPKPSYQTLRLILGDQLNRQHSWFNRVNPRTLYLMAEMHQETSYALHHSQKITAFFLSMRSFASEMQQEGHQFHYIQINQPEALQSLPKLIADYISKYNIQQFEYQEPDEYRLDQQLYNLRETLTIPTQSFSTEHFYTSRTDLKELFEGKKQFLMETFYRSMRRKFQVLMEGKEPTGGQWNFDHDNRHHWDGKTKIPAIPALNNQPGAVIKQWKESGVQALGHDGADAFHWPVNRSQSIQLLKHFIADLLPHFGKYQDAMFDGDPFLFHSRISFALNVKMLHPKEVVQSVEDAWRSDPKRIPLSAAEGFIRQILGWREYMRGLYWLRMPEFANDNYFQHDRPLPAFYWTGETSMNCLKHAITESLDNAYAHHIQRLMITGNFALLNHTHPAAVDAWYLGIYADAVEWVQLPNTRGMSQYADGGVTATKPYISGGAYIKKMSNYCKGCIYDPSKRTGAGACPFNFLYWNFLETHRELLSKNPRMGMMYKTLDRLPDREAISSQSAAFLASLK